MDSQSTQSQSPQSQGAQSRFELSAGASDGASSGLNPVGRLMLVERSASMRRALAQHLFDLGYEVMPLERHADASSHLAGRFEPGAERIDAVVLGWPTVMEADVEACLDALQAGEHTDLPLVVLSTDMRAESLAWIGQREGARLLNWKEYQRVGEQLADLMRQPGDPVSATSSAGEALTLMVVDENEVEREALGRQFSDQGYAVQLAGSAADAIALARAGRIDLALIDLACDEQQGDRLCQQLSDDPTCRVRAVAMLLEHPSDPHLVRALRAGAVQCLYRSESCELQVARIDAVARLLGEALVAEPAPSPSPLLSALQRIGWGAESLPLLTALKRRRAAADDPSTTGSAPGLLMLVQPVFRESATTESPQASTDRTDDAARLRIVALDAEARLALLPQAPAHVVRVEGHRLLLLLDAAPDGRGYQQVRRVMQTLNAFEHTTGDESVACVASVLAPLAHPTLSMQQLISRLRGGLAFVAGHEVDKALLLDLKRMLPVYPRDVS